MILLASTSALLRVITSAAVPVDVHASWVDLSGSTVTPGQDNTQITTASSTTVIPSPGASTARNVKGFLIRNKSATTGVMITIEHTDGTTTVELVKQSLNAGESLIYEDGQGWSVLSDSATVFSPSSDGLAPASGGGTANFLRADGSWAEPAPDDPWTYVFLDTAAITTLTSDTATDLFFAPDANKRYVVEAWLYLQAAATTTGPRPGISWPTGTVQNAAMVIAPTSATAFVSRFWGNTTTANAASTGVPVANEGIFGKVEAMFVTGGSPSGNFAITIASEIAGSEARIMQNSFLRYREV